MFDAKTRERKLKKENQNQLSHEHRHKNSQKKKIVNEPCNTSYTKTMWSLSQEFNT